MLINRPPMGWNSWNTFGTNISEDLIKETADAIVATGLKDAGYEYVVIDDCWSLKERDADGKIVADPEKFPHGMKALADYVHSKGLKFGMYSCDGPLTCAGYPASFDHEFEDAKLFAEWGVDYLKYDNCYKPQEYEGKVLYNRMSMALKASGRDIVFSACNWGAENVHQWIRSTGAHLYRSTGDINDSFGSVKNLSNSQIDLLGYSAPGCFNDVDMLICGMYGKGNVAVSGCTDTEYKTHFALWCLFASPLMIGCDVRNMTPATLELLKNKDLIAINQDAEARPPFVVNKAVVNNQAPKAIGSECYDGCYYSVLKHLENGEYAIAYFNMSDADVTVPCNFAGFGLGESTGYGFNLKNIFTGETFSGVTGKFDCKLDAHDCAVFRAELVKVK